MIRIKRVYEPAAREDGERFLVERLWPRGIKKEALPMKAWCKEAAPSSELRQWFHHDPAKWTQFEKRYRAELDANPSGWHSLQQAAKHGSVTLLYSSRDTQHNNAVVLASYLKEHLSSKSAA
ncbi:MAG: DUF488 domain-containing protein [Verrucomicrobia bacterium]|nr:DUF488 domain-containing protein [Verrucomicrobiota bacterium]